MHEGPALARAFVVPGPPRGRGGRPSGAVDLCAAIRPRRRRAC